MLRLFSALKCRLLCRSETCMTGGEAEKVGDVRHLSNQVELGRDLSSDAEPHQSGGISCDCIGSASKVRNQRS